MDEDNFEEEFDYSDDLDEDEESEDGTDDEDSSESGTAVEESPDIVEESDEYDSDFRYSVLWDLEAGDFKLDGNGNMIECDGYEAYKVWCVKTVLTQRDALRAYADDIGTELEEALDNSDHGLVEAELESTTVDALLVNPRTADVSGFAFAWSGDALTVSFTVTPTEGEDFAVTI